MRYVIGEFSLLKPYAINYYVSVYYITMSSKSSNTQKGLKQRTISNGLNLVESQLSTIYEGTKHDLLTIPCVSQISFGGQATYKIQEKNICLHDINIAFAMGALSGLTGGPARFSNTNNWWHRCEIKQNGVVKQTILPTANHLINQLFFSDEDRTLTNNLGGHYASTAQRVLMSSSANTYILSLASLFNATSLPILTSSHEVEVILFLNPLEDIVVRNGATGTPTVQIFSSSVMSKITRMSQDIAESRLSNMAIQPEHSIFHTTKHTQYQVPTGSTTSQFVLNNLAGSKVALMMFVVRPVAGLTGDGLTTYLPISSFTIRDAANTHITGGLEVTQAVSNFLAQYWVESTYNCETALTSGKNGIIYDSSAYVQLYSHSANIVDAFHRGRMNGSREYFGNESLFLSFKSGVSVPTVVDVYCLCEAVVQQTPTSVQVLEGSQLM